MKRFGLFPRVVLGRIVWEPGRSWTWPVAAVMLTVGLTSFSICAQSQRPPPVPPQLSASGAVGSLSLAVEAAIPQQATLKQAASVSGTEPLRQSYAPTYLPKEVELSKEQVEAIRAATVSQMIAYRETLVNQNKVAAAKDELWLVNARRSSEADQWNRTHTQEVLSQHSYFSMFIFWMVIAIVVVSLALSVHQFMRDSANAEMVMRKLLRMSKPVPASDADSADIASGDQTDRVIAAAAAAAATATTSDSKAIELAIYKTLRAEHTVTVGSSGLQLGTQLVGLVMLCLSMGFFYLYLDKVYPVTFAARAAVAPDTVSKR